jgi:hypothetical protein
MKKIFYLFLIFGYLYSYGQSCPGYSSITDPSLSLCGVYGDAAGNSRWNWEAKETDPDYCKTWLARITDGSDFVTALTSPFTNVVGGKLYDIFISEDYKRANGWELLYRNFGCFGTNSKPFFILVNKYTGLARVYVYLPGSQETYTKIAISLKPIGSPTAITSGSHEPIFAPDKYKNQQVGSQDELISINESNGFGWQVGEFSLIFDPYITGSWYTNASINLVVYGIKNSDFNATINGIAANNVAKNFSFTTTNNSATSSGGFDFTAKGEKITKLGEKIENARKNINEGAKKVGNALNGSPVNSIKGDLLLAAVELENFTDESGGLGKILSGVSGTFKAAGGALSLIGTVTGFFSSSESKPAVTYSSYNLALAGTISGKTTIASATFSIPGAIQSVNNTSNTYYNCPVGFFNIKSTPVLQKVAYNRFVGKWHDGWGTYNDYDPYISYKVKTDIPYSYNSANVEVVSVEAALIGTVGSTLKQDGPDKGKVESIAYDLFRENEYGNASTIYRYNPMLADLYANKLFITNYDVDNKVHTFQTEFVNIECFKGTSFTVHQGTNVSVRVKAKLKRRDDNTILYFIKDYQVDTENGTADNPNYTDNSTSALTPYSNYTIPSMNTKTIISTDLSLEGKDFANTNSYEYSTYVDNSVLVLNRTLTLKNTTIPNLFTFVAGREILLKDEQSITSGKEILLTNDFGKQVVCGVKQEEAFVYSGPCYNTSSQAHKVSQIKKKTLEEIKSEVKLSPNPSDGTFLVEAPLASGNNIIIADQMGRIIYHIPVTNNTDALELNLKNLNPGLYIVKIYTNVGVIDKKIVIAK